MNETHCGALQSDFELPNQWPRMPSSALLLSALNEGALCGCQLTGQFSALFIHHDSLPQPRAHEPSPGQHLLINLLSYSPYGQSYLCVVPF